ncbi:MAG: hypothetical protein FJW39_01515 [Acidobacteria bacterium]|nr:hypothetical protein [Acidobacteriota bacterium]
MHSLLPVSLLVAAPLLAQAPASISDLAWIAGSWAGSLGRAQVEEHWLTPSGGAMLGMSRTLAGEKMVMFEFLRIETRPDGVYYVAQPNGRPPTGFKLTRSSPKLAVFENPQHDHPKIITYELTDPQSLTATIEGDQGGKNRKTVFQFKRTKLPPPAGDPSARR